MTLPTPQRSDALTTDFSTRLITLSDGRPGLRGGMHIDIREPSPTLDSGPKTQDCSHCLDFIASDESLDRYDEIVTASGWKLESYRRNPVFQNAHKYGDVIFTLGKALATELRSVAGRQALCQTVEFAVDVNPMAKIAYGLYKGKFLNAVSVGFIPLKWENGDGTSSRSVIPSPRGEGQGEGERPSTLDLGLRTLDSAPFRRRYLEQELLEVSAVGIPANPNALALGLKAGAVEKSDLKDTLDLLRRTLDAAPSPSPSPGGEGQGEGGTVLSHSPALSLTHSRQILALARDLHALLRRC